MLELKIVLDRGGYVASWCSQGDIGGGVAATVDDPDHFAAHCFEYRLLDGQLQHDPDKPAPVMPYRQARKARYIAELSEEGTFQTTTGDMLDALTKAVYGDLAELDKLRTKIDAIKAGIPKN